jgi:hypothetical protein
MTHCLTHVHAVDMQVEHALQLQLRDQNMLSQGLYACGIKPQPEVLCELQSSNSFSRQDNLARRKPVRFLSDCLRRILRGEAARAAGGYIQTIPRTHFRNALHLVTAANY